ncbi:type II secretion system minor pseudopilin GspH [Alteromonas sp. 5E99-2]|uniref:type II secretion system minor pseudopilin GspH n=1 Tax=Alteromonas sp. 5E99-2 TaxID=2817683 RepID=UPI001A99F914|nr:type II secretion system minor pseudopilin GspH [Alteromonas sp. 5E99-2]MBO1256831.1 type II secretion system minor pseudopilin GspH [Alteromonas sp. 5E99-2]
MQLAPMKASKNLGFTLIEILLVLLLMGLATSYVMFNAFSVDQQDKLKDQARRFQVVVDMASDYAVLNQLQLGIRIEEAENQYFFMVLDEDNKWQLLSDDPLYGEQLLPEEFELALSLDDLPWEEADRLFDREIFDEKLSLDDASVDIGDKEEKPLPPPQILIMSSGEITPFSLEWIYEPTFNDDAPAYFYLNNKDVPPLELLGPFGEAQDA